LGRLKRRSNKHGYFHKVDRDLYDRFQDAADSRHKKYSDVVESLISKWTEKIEAENRELEANKQERQREATDYQLQGILQSRIRDVKHRIDSGIVEGSDLEREKNRLAQAEIQLEALRYKRPDEEQLIDRNLQEKSLKLR
jgi:hypothetical protein